jgi:hypothetical protein
MKGLWIGIVICVGAGSWAWGAGPCEENRGQTGVALAVAPAGGLAVAAVDDDSPAAASGLAVGDVVLQVNGTLVGGCGEYARAVRDARQNRKALLVLVRRGGGEVPLVLAGTAWDRVVASVPPPAPAEPPSVRTIVAAPPPPPLPPATTVTVDGVTRGLAALATEAGPRAQSATYQRDVGRVERQVETLAARGSAPAPVVAGLRTVLRYYRAAGVAWASAEDQRQRERRPRHVPTVETSTAPYFADSDVAVVIDEFPFLRETVARDPQPSLLVGESAGLWRPLQARTLLWERGRDELSRFTTWLASGVK